MEETLKEMLQRKEKRWEIKRNVLKKNRKKTPKASYKTKERALEIKTTRCCI
jgi:hypothetical protein